MEKNTEQLDAIEGSLKAAAHEAQLAQALAQVAVVVAAIADRPELLAKLQEEAAAGVDATDYVVACELVYKQTLARVQKTHPDIAGRAAVTAVYIFERSTRQISDAREFEQLMGRGGLFAIRVDDE